MTRPKRIQRKRTKGWRMPANTVYVGRPTKWGNQYRAGEFSRNRYPVSVEQAVAFYRQYIEEVMTKNPARKELKGKNLACWCPIRDKYGKIVPCHADILLEIANS